MLAKPRKSPLELIILDTGFLQRGHNATIDYLLAANRPFRQRLVSRRLRFTDPERELLAPTAKNVSRAVLEKVATLTTPEALLRWRYRRLVADKYDGSRKK